MDYEKMYRLLLQRIGSRTADHEEEIVTLQVKWEDALNKNAQLSQIAEELQKELDSYMPAPVQPEEVPE